MIIISAQFQKRKRKVKITIKFVSFYPKILPLHAIRKHQGG